MTQRKRAAIVGSKHLNTMATSHSTVSANTLNKKKHNAGIMGIINIDIAKHGTTKLYGLILTPTISLCVPPGMKTGEGKLGTNNSFVSVRQTFPPCSYQSKLMGYSVEKTVTIRIVVNL